MINTPYNFKIFEFLLALFESAILDRIDFLDQISHFGANLLFWTESVILDRIGYFGPNRIKSVILDRICYFGPYWSYLDQIDRNWIELAILVQMDHNWINSVILDRIGYFGPHRSFWTKLAILNQIGHI